MCTEYIAKHQKMKGPNIEETTESCFKKEKFASRWKVENRWGVKMEESQIYGTKFRLNRINSSQHVPWRLQYCPF